MRQIASTAALRRIPVCRETRPAIRKISSASTAFTTRTTSATARVRCVSRGSARVRTRARVIVAYASFCSQGELRQKILHRRRQMRRLFDKESRHPGAALRDGRKLAPCCLPVFVGCFGFFVFSFFAANPISTDRDFSKMSVTRRRRSVANSEATISANASATITTTRCPRRWRRTASLQASSGSLWCVSVVVAPS